VLLLLLAGCHYSTPDAMNVACAACRSRERAAEAVSVIEAECAKHGVAVAGGRVGVVELDLCSLTSIDAAAQAFRELGRPLHVLVLNAGILPMDNRSRTADGFERYDWLRHGVSQCWRR